MSESFFTTEALMTHIKEVTGTAFVVAEFRAQENSQDAPLYQDWVVELFLSEDSKRAAGRVAASFPPARDLVRIRTRYFDDVLDGKIASGGVRQVVILGAGLDTRAVRKRAPGVAYFEIDDQATLTLKRSRYAKYRIDSGVTFIPGDYVTDGLITLLKQNGFACDAPSYFIWEGNTMYLPLQSVTQMLAEVRTHVARFCVSFDYMDEAVIARTTGDAGITRLVDSFADMGAPWVTGIRDVHGLARELGLSVAENITTSELRQRYWPDRAAESAIFRFYSVCTLASDASSMVSPAPGDDSAGCS
jgi:methyltransferase (TIGR00027 family)